MTAEHYVRLIKAYRGLTDRSLNNKTFTSNGVSIYTPSHRRIRIQIDAIIDHIIKALTIEEGTQFFVLSEYVDKRS